MKSDPLRDRIDALMYALTRVETGAEKMPHDQWLIDTLTMHIVVDALQLVREKPL